MMQQNRRKNWIVRPMTDEDIPAAARVEMECFPDPWSEDSLKGMLGGRGCYGWAIFDGEEPAGYCLVQQVLDEGEILRIAVFNKFKRQGAAGCLLEEIFKQNPETVFWNLEVREGNVPAVRCYEKFGFVALGIRKNYYKDPVENALVMQKADAQ